MAFGSINTPGAPFAALKKLVGSVTARLASMEKTLTGMEQLTGTQPPGAQVAAAVGQIYIDVLTGNSYKCVAVNSGGSVWELQSKTGVALTAADIGAVPATRKVNNKALSADITLTASDVGARPSSWTPTAAQVGAVPTTRKVNNKALSADITLSAADVGARASSWTPTAADVGAVPTSRKVNNKALSADITLTASDVGARASSWVPTAAQVGAKSSSWSPFAFGTSAPSDKTQLWIDTTANTGGLKYYNGSAWVLVPVGYQA